MTRHRLVREIHRPGQDIVRDVSGTILAPDEIPEILHWEGALHTAGGWHVRSWPGMVRAEKPGCVRWLYVRTSNAMEDTLT